MIAGLIWGGLTAVIGGYLLSVRFLFWVCEAWKEWEEDLAPVSLVFSALLFLAGMGAFFTGLCLHFF